jgi:hypothetical protein
VPVDTCLYRCSRRSTIQDHLLNVRGHHRAQLTPEGRLEMAFLGALY